jgi:hypothetical protein
MLRAAISPATSRIVFVQATRLSCCGTSSSDRDNCASFWFDVSFFVGAKLFLGVRFDVQCWMFDVPA